MPHDGSLLARGRPKLGALLAIARRLVEAMGGSMHIESELAVGTTVRFSFLAEVAVPKSRAASDGQAPLLGKRVLLVSRSRSDVGVLVQQLIFNFLMRAQSFLVRDHRVRLRAGDPVMKVLATSEGMVCTWTEAEASDGTPSP